MAAGIKSVFLMAGHGSRRTGRDPVIARALGETGVQQPRAAYVGAASGDNQPFYLMIATMLRASGCGPVTLAPTVGNRVKLEKTRAILAESDLIFVSGGDVYEGMQVLESCNLCSLLRELYEAGRVFCGVSAGSIMLAHTWVHWPDPDDDGSAELFPCLGIADLICDTHGEADAWEELRTAVRLNPESTIGYGIRSGSALVQLPGGGLESAAGTIDTFENLKGVATPSQALHNR
ncbi:MAG: Type 1 glutamine amidotransferase-like domain-containing protein [Anaerolineae bacterium]